MITINDLPSQGIHLWGSLFWGIRTGRHFPRPRAVVPPDHCAHMLIIVTVVTSTRPHRKISNSDERDDFCWRPRHHIGSPLTSGARWISTRCREACKTPLAAIIIMITLITMMLLLLMMMLMIGDAYDGDLFWVYRGRRGDLALCYSNWHNL